jgi:hypothetical protein
MGELAADVLAELSTPDEFAGRCGRLEVTEAPGLTLDTAAELYGNVT